MEEKNVSTGHYNHKGKELLRAVKEYNNFGYKEWSKKNEYGKKGECNGRHKFISEEKICYPNCQKIL